MVMLQFLGATDTVTGSKTVIEHGLGACDWIELHLFVDVE